MHPQIIEASGRSFALSPRHVLSAVMSLGALALTAAPAHAGLLVEEAASCSERVTSQPFTRWLDYAHYVLTPGGRAESPDGWTLDRASITAGNEPWRVMDPDDRSSLRLPAGAQATTDAMCVGLDSPTLRFFSRSSGTSLRSSLAVDVLVEDRLGLVTALPVARVLPRGAWSPGVPYVIAASLLPLLPDSQTLVAFRFRPTGPGTWWVDDVLVDPYKRG